MLAAVVDDIPPVRMPSGHRRVRPGKLDANKTSHAGRGQAEACGCALLHLVVRGVLQS